MKAVAPLFLVLAFSVSLAAAQTATAQSAGPESHIDTVNVAGQKQKDPAPERHFAESVLQPSTTDENQYAAWKAKICPLVIGRLDAADRVFVEQRIKQIATQVGAPVNRNDPCITNINIIFTDDPQEALNIITKRNPDLVVSYTPGAPKITHPIQSFYETLMRDNNGVLTLDQDWQLAGLSHPPWIPANGSRLSWGIIPEMGVATVFVDVKTVIGHSLGEVADYLALMTLSQSHPDENCKQLPSIANLLATNCPTGNLTDSISDTDIALLTGLYQSTSGPDQLQRQRLIAGMKKSLEAHSGN